MCVKFFSATFVSDIFCLDKYLKNGSRDACRFAPCICYFCPILAIIGVCWWKSVETLKLFSNSHDVYLAPGSDSFTIPL